MTRSARSPSPELVHTFAAPIQTHPHAVPLAERLEADRVEAMDQVRSAFQAGGLCPGLTGGPAVDVLASADRQAPRSQDTRRPQTTPQTARSHPGCRTGL